MGQVAINNEILLLGVVSLPYCHLMPKVRTRERKGWFRRPRSQLKQLLTLALVETFLSGAP